jgi:uncharacterized membrane protein
MNRRELKTLARESLKDNWGIAIGAMLLYMLVTYILGATGIGSFFLGFIVAGYYAVNLNLIRTKTAKIEDLFSGCKNFVTNFVAYLLMQVFIALWSLLFFIPGIVKSYSYAMTMYILNDHPEMSASEAITESRKMMNGHKAELFVLHLSFLGWIILSSFTFGILLLYVMPYMQATSAAFYEKLKEMPVIEDSVE